MLVAHYHNSSGIAYDPDRAVGSVFRLNNTVYEVQSIRTGRDDDTGEREITSLMVRKWQPEEQAFAAVSRVTAERYVEALSSITFPFDPYALYNRYLPSRFGSAQAVGVLRRHRHSYVRNTSSATVRHYAVNGIPFAHGEVRHVSLSGAEEGETISSEVLACSLIGQYPTIADLVNTATPYSMLGAAAIDGIPLNTAALSPSCFITVCRGDSTTRRANLGFRDFSSQDPWAYVVVPAIVDYAAMIVTIKVPADSADACLKLLNAACPAESIGWTYTTTP